MAINITQPTFNNEFDLTTRDLSEIYIKETYYEEKCVIWDLKDNHKAYNSFILSKNTQSKIVCVISFHKSSQTSKYLPRPTFKRLNLQGEEQVSASTNKVNISLSKSEDALNFWKLIVFLNSYKDLVDFGGFDTTFKVVSSESFIVEFKNKGITEKIKDLKDLIEQSDLNSNQIKSLIFETRKKDIKAFYYLLKGIKNCHEEYRKKFNIPQGEESIWHHFLKTHDRILGLNVDIKFIRDFYDEQKIGLENSLGQQSPKTDMLGISDYTTLIELKHSNTEIFKKTKSKGRANTWDFTADFVEAISQCLGQKFELEKIFEQKQFIKDGKRLDKNGIEALDTKTLLIIGNKRKEFPIDDLERVREFEKLRVGSIFVVTKHQRYDKTVYRTDRLPMGCNIGIFRFKTQTCCQFKSCI